MALAPTIIVADDHPLFREALSQAVSSSLPAVTVVNAHDICSLQQCVEEHPFASLILLDLHMPGAHGFSGLIHLSAHHPEIPIIIVSAHESENIMRRALDHGASGFIPKSSPMESIAATIEKVLDGELCFPSGIDDSGCATSDEERGIANILSTLTPQQYRVATMLAQGLLNKQIAYELNVTEATIKAHATEIFRKLGVHSRTQAVLAIGQLDVLPPGAEQL